MTTYTVWSLDVWGNADDGYDVNDRCKVGSVDIEETADDTAVMLALVEAGYLKPGSETVGQVDSDSSPDALYIGDKRDGCPWLQLEREMTEAELRTLAKRNAPTVRVERT